MKIKWNPLDFGAWTKGQMYDISGHRCQAFGSGYYIKKTRLMIIFTRTWTWSFQISTWFFLLIFTWSCGAFWKWFGHRILLDVYLLYFDIAIILHILNRNKYWSFNLEIRPYGLRWILIGVRLLGICLSFASSKFSGTIDWDRFCDWLWDLRII